MEEKQIVQQESSAVSAPDMTTTEIQPNPTLDFLQRLVIYCPWLLVVLLLAVFIGGGVASLYSLGHVEEVEVKQTSEVIEVVEPIVSPPENPQPLPPWIVGAIALSCASGCVVILRWLNRPVQVQTTHKHVNRYQARLAQRRQQHVEGNLSKNNLVITPPSAIKPPTSPPVIKKTKKMVTIIPSSQHQVLVRQESLADSLDIRKEKPLSSMLQKDS